MTRLITCLLALFATGLAAHTSAQAEPPLCKGTNLMAELQTSDPATYAAVMAEARAIPNGEALFWKIERDGVAPSFLVGTAHVTDPRVTGLPPEPAAALAKASIVALELAELGNQKQLLQATLKNARLMVMPAGKTLWDLVPDADEPLIRNNANLPPGASETLYGYQPWVVVGMLSIPLCELTRKGQGLDVLDSQIAHIAESNGTPLVGLETVAEQLAVFANMPLDLQTKYLVAVAKLGPRTGDFFETLVALYESHNVAAYMPFVAHTGKVSADDREIMAFVEEDLVRKRNHRMAERAAALLAKGNAFIAVGALHLSGREGLVELIRAAGYRVTSLN